MPRTALRAIPTNLVMGFLGVGKTTAILHLLAHKPENERWAVLVNEFGSVGIDGAILGGRGAVVREVPGGCMCCAAGVPLQVAVNRLLRSARPDRLLIEPSGLGHPRRVLATLAGEHFRAVLDLRAALCLVDPRKLADPRYREHEHFVDQLQLADVLVANKTDLADAEDLQRFQRWANRCTPAKTVVARTTHGRVDPAWIDLPRHPHRPPVTTVAPQDSGYHSQGWTFPATAVFDHTRLCTWIGETAPQRLKGVVRTERGWFVFNYSDGRLHVTATRPRTDSRIERLDRTEPATSFEAGLLACRRDAPGTD